MTRRLQPPDVHMLHAPVRWRSAVAVVPAIRHPLPYVPVHVMQTERIRRIAPDRNRASPIIPVIRQRRRQAPTEMIPPRRPRPRHVLPLGLAQQPVLMARLLRQPAHIRLRVTPAHVDDRTYADFVQIARQKVQIETRKRPSAAASAHTRIPLHERHLVHPHRERARYRHLTHRTFVVRAALLRLRRAHGPVISGSTKISLAAASAISRGISRNLDFAKSLMPRSTKLDNATATDALASASRMLSLNKGFSAGTRKIVTATKMQTSTKRDAR